MYEVELKSLINKNAIPGIISSVKNNYNNFEFLREESMKTFYFEPLDSHEKLIEYYMDKIPNISSKLHKDNKNVSVRAREINEKKVIFIIKISYDNQNSNNGDIREEIEYETEDSLNDLEQRILSLGYKVSSKWFRDRKVFSFGNDFKICFDDNSGFGHFIEVEKVIKEKNKIDETKQDIEKIFKTIGLEKIENTKLTKMFDFYEKNWEKYYLTKNSLILE